MHMIRRQLYLALLGAALTTLAFSSWAQSYPTKPIRLVVPTVPGGATDFTARYIAQRLGPALGQAVVVDNRSGADGQIGAEFVARAVPDAYTLVMPITSFSSNPSLYDKLPFDAEKDFEPIALIAKAPLMLVVNPQVPAESVATLVTYARDNSGKLNFGNSGSGTMSNFAAQLFRKMSGVNIVPIGYKGGGQIMTDLVGGHLQIYFSTIPAAQQLVEAGKLRALAVTSPARVPSLPNIPSLAESGFPGFDVVGWFGLFAPAGTPRPLIEKINLEVQKILAQPETRSAFSKEGLTVEGGSAQEFRQFLHADIAKWKRIVAETGIKRD